MLYLDFNGEPKAVQSFRFTRDGHRYQPSDVVDWKNWIKLQAREQLGACHDPYKGPISISVRFCFSPLKSFSKKQNLALATGQTLYKITKPDLTDNLLKGFIDALSGIIWERDQQIVKVDSEKVYGLAGKTELWVKELES